MCQLCVKKEKGRGIELRGQIILEKWTLESYGPGAGPPPVNHGIKYTRVTGYESTPA